MTYAKRRNRNRAYRNAMKQERRGRYDAGSKISYWSVSPSRQNQKNRF